MMERIQAGDGLTMSMDGLAENIRKLKELFPELVTEAEGGHAINVDVLKGLVGDRTVTDAQEKYGLNWFGKRQARQLALTPSLGTLRPCKDESVDWDTTKNLMIEGDNLEVLKLLRKSYAGKVKLIYIDPPYNTGKDFVYPDNFQDNVKNYLELTGQVDGAGRRMTTNTEASGRFHTDWLNMMYPRLKLARELLAEDGVIAISIDHHEVSNLKGALVDLFGGDNAVNTITWVNNLKGRQISSHGAALTHEFVVVWGKNKDAVAAFTIPVELAKARLPGAYRGFNYEVLQDAKGEYVLKNQLYNTNSAFNEQTRANLVFNIHYNPATGAVRTTDVDDPQLFDGFQVVRPHRCNDGKHRYHAWRWGRPKVENESEDLAFVQADEGLQIFTKVRGHASTVLKDLITDISTSEGSADVSAVLGSSPFSYPKPLILIQLLLQAATSQDENAIVLDFFAGSGTSAHATMAQNLVDSGNRRFIVVQLPVPLDPTEKEQKVAADFCDTLHKPRTIAELTKERLRRAGAKLRSENPLFSGDLGFRVFKLDSTNIRAWDPHPTDLTAELQQSLDHLRTDRTDDDIAFEFMLKYGIDLSTPIEERTIAGKRILSIGAGAVLACLDRRISNEDAEAVALGMVEWWKTLRPHEDDKDLKRAALFRDAAFASDATKLNLVEILKHYGPTKVYSL